MKRSRKAVLTVMATVVIVACEPVEPVKVFQNMQQCEVYYAGEVCKRQYASAQEKNRLAPRFESKQDCDSEFGKCESRGGSGFYPVMNGFVAPSNYNSAIASQPLYGNNKTMEGYKVHDGMKTTPSSLATPKTSTNVPRGGFGARGASISSGG